MNDKKSPILEEIGREERREREKRVQENQVSS
jgi:hypothetical protein